MNNDIYQEDNINNSFIIEKSDGNYDIYINNIFRYSLDDLNDLDNNLQDTPIYEEGRNKNGK